LMYETCLRAGERPHTEARARKLRSGIVVNRNAFLI
jgi:hypothetical protein